MVVLTYSCIRRRSHLLESRRVHYFVIVKFTLALFIVVSMRQRLPLLQQLQQQQALLRNDEKGALAAATVGGSGRSRSSAGSSSSTLSTVSSYNMSKVRFAEHHVLDVPFYVYEDLAWEDATVDGVPIHESVVRHHLTDNNKHTDDYWFMLAALRHPMRTLDPADAKLFVVPPLLNCYEVRRLVEGKTAYQNTV